MTNESPLGKSTDYAEQYDPDLLFPIARADSRVPLGLTFSLPFDGSDLWTAWEVSWLNAAGLPQIASASLQVPCDSPNLIESKSLKLYLGSFAMTPFESAQELTARINADLSACCGSPVKFRLHSSTSEVAVQDFAGTCIDNIDTRINVFNVDAGLLANAAGESTETLYSHLLRSLCPVTNQPDLGSVLVRYSGPRIDPAALLHYIVSFRQHNDFHEACVERMFLDIAERCRPERLTVYARYQRRGGLDINPFRSNFEDSPPSMRLPRQ